MTADPQRYRELFRAEAEEHLAALGRELVRLEGDPMATGAMAEVARSLHTVKGMAAAMGYDGMATLAHALEELLEAVRAGREPAGAAFVDLALAGVDALATGLRDEDSAEFEAAAREVRERIAGCLAAPGGPAGGSDVEAGAGAVRAAAAPGAVPSAGRSGPDTVRVRRELLDRLLNGAGELVVATQRVEELARGLSGELGDESRRAARLAAALHREALAGRMVPVAMVFDRFPRAVRDHARRIGKRVELEVEGRDIEIDRAILDDVAEPLLHLLRNAVDHGIEPPDERAALGKRPSGTVRLGALRRGHHVLLEVADDGRGLDRKRLGDTALARGLVGAEELGAMVEGALDRLATLRGLSTASGVSETSGRGVGLDAVETAVARLGGALEIRSDPGRGAAFTLRLPLTLAVQRVLVVESAGGRYAVPVAAVVELVRPPAEGPSGPGPLEVRGERLPWLPLAVALGVADRAWVPYAVEGAVSSSSSPGGSLAVVVRAGAGRLGLTVDRVLGNRETVVRPLPPLRGSRLPFSGVTILADGSLAPLVDAARLAAPVSAAGRS